MNAVQGERRANTWLTFAELGALTGKTSSAVRMWVKRRTAKGEHVQVKKERGKHGEVWYIHSSEVSSFSEREGAPVQGEREPLTQGERVNTITVEYYDAQRKIWERERDELSSGLMMYRYKFEELERQVRLLPAPPEVVTSKLIEMEQKLSELDEKELALSYSQQAINDLETELRTKCNALNELDAELQHERSLNWWKRSIRALKKWWG